MLGQELVRAFSRDEKYAVTGWDREDIDVTDFVFLEERLTTLRPDIVINAVAYNAVDACEAGGDDHMKALVLNRDVPRFLAEMSEKLSFVLVHYSTD